MASDVETNAEINEVKLTPEKLSPVAAEESKDYLLAGQNLDFSPPPKYHENPLKSSSSSQMDRNENNLDPADSSSRINGDDCAMVQSKESIEDVTYCCQICFDQHPRSMGFILSCGHCFCRGCMVEFLRANITDGQVFLKCFHIDYSSDAEAFAFSESGKLAEKCGTSITDEEIALLLKPPDADIETGSSESGETADIWKKYQRFKFIRDNKDARECPECGIFNIGQPQETPRITCEGCQRIYCFFHANAHDFEKFPTCEEYEKSIAGEVQSSVDLINSQSKPCPGCHIHVMKSGGCNHMKCQCGVAFCWLCGKEIDDTLFPAHFQWWNPSGCTNMQMNEAVEPSPGARFWACILSVLQMIIFGPLTIISCCISSVLCSCCILHKAKTEYQRRKREGKGNVTLFAVQQEFLGTCMSAWGMFWMFFILLIPLALGVGGIFLVVVFMVLIIWYPCYACLRMRARKYPWPDQLTYCCQGIFRALSLWWQDLRGEQGNPAVSIRSLRHMDIDGSRRYYQNSVSSRSVRSNRSMRSSNMSIRSTSSHSVTDLPSAAVSTAPPTDGEAANQSADGAVDIGSAEDITPQRRSSHGSKNKEITAVSEDIDVTSNKRTRSDGGMLRWFSFSRSSRLQPAEQKIGMNESTADLEQQDNSSAIETRSNGNKVSLSVPLNDTTTRPAPLTRNGSSGTLSDKNIVTETSVLSRMGQHRLIRIDVTASDDEDEILPVDIEKGLYGSSPTEERSRIAFHSTGRSTLDLMQPAESGGVVSESIDHELAQQTSPVQIDETNFTDDAVSNGNDELITPIGDKEHPAADSVSRHFKVTSVKGTSSNPDGMVHIEVVDGVAKSSERCGFPRDRSVDSFTFSEGEAEPH